MGAPRIMVVEDEQIIALDIRISLEKMGYEVPYLATSGEEAVEKASQVKPDLMLMDIRLRGGMDGVETALQIFEKIDVPIVYLSGYTDCDTVDRAKLSQPFGYLSKPFRKKDLQATIEVALHRYEMEKQVREREQWLSTTLRTIGDAVIAGDVDGRILFMNPVAQMLTGWQEFEALGLEVTQVLHLVDGTGQNLVSHPFYLAQSGLSTAEAEAHIYLVSQTGRKMPVECSAAPILSHNGSLSGVVSVFRDATPGQALDAHRDMGRMASGIAHDFNNKLTVIMGMSELLSSGLKDNPELLEMSQEIQSVCQDSIALTRRLLAMSRKDYGRCVNRDINAVIKNVEMTVGSLLGNQINITTELDEDLAKVECDPIYLERIILNLMLNARDSMPAGGILALTTCMETLREQPALLAFPFSPGKYAVVKIQHAVPVTRVGDSTTYSGAIGPSLSAVFGTVKHNHGNIRIEPGPGPIIAIYIYLPISAGEKVESGVPR